MPIMPLKRFYRLQRMRLSAAPMALRPVLGWRAKILRASGLLLLAVLLGVLGAWLGWREAVAVHQAGFSGQSDRIEKLDRALASEVDARRLLDQQLTMERATREMLAKELALAQAQAATRQEALTFLDALLTSNDRSRAVRLVACELQPVEARQYRYRALLAQGFNGAAEFSGRVLVNVDYQRRGQRGRLTLGQDKPIPVLVKHYDRAEGELTLPSDAIPLSVDIRVLSLDGRQVVAQCQKKIGGV